MRKLILISFGISFIAISCTKQPVACFKSSATTAKTGESISFKDCSENAVIYEWNFGDGSKSDKASPSHSYTVAGTYTVKLTVTSKNGKKSDLDDETITITPAGTCTDGLQNQGETGIDCGGPCTACGGTCTDGIQNQGETGIDCGGPCPACVSGAVQLSNNVFATGTISNGGEVKWYYFNAVNGTTYNVMWDDSYSGSGNYTCDVLVSAYRQDGTTVYSTLNNYDSGYSSPASIVAAATEKVYLKVSGYSSSSTGTFAIKYY